MSRHSVSVNENLVLEYGFDRVPRPGYFFSVSRNGETVDGGDTRSAMVIPPEKHMNRSEIADRLAKYGAPERHIRKVAEDLPI